jgi:hypothetical protein
MFTQLVKNFAVPLRHGTVHRGTQNGPPPDTILRQMNAAHVLFKINFNIVLLSKVIILSDFPTKSFIFFRICMPDILQLPSSFVTSP